MKKWFYKLAGWQKTTLHFILFFLIYLLLYLSFDVLWPLEEAFSWKNCLTQAFVFSFILEFLFNWLIVVPNYFKKKKADEPFS